MAQHVLVEEVGERPVTHVVEKPGQPKRLDHQAFGRWRFGRLGFGQGGEQARIQMTRPQAGLVHDPQAVGEAAVFGRREDPSGALELADAAHPLQPGGIEKVAFGGGLLFESQAARAIGRQSLGQLDIAVNRVAD